MKYFETLYKSHPNHFEIGAPIVLKEVAIIYDTVDKKNLLRNVFVNNSKKTIVAFEVQISIQNIFSDPIAINENGSIRYLYQDALVEPEELFGNKIAIELPDAARKAFVNVSKVAFQDGDIWESKPENIVLVQPQKEIQASDSFIAQIDDYNIPPHYYYLDNDSCWQCTCGQPNHNGDSVCVRCGRHKEYVRAFFSTSNISDKFNDFVAKAENEKKKRLEELKAIEAEKKRIRDEEIKQAKLREQIEINRNVAEKKKTIRKAKKISLVAVIIMICLIATNQIFKCYILPNRNYNKAVSLMEQEQYNDAIDLFERLNGYKESYENILECTYCIAQDKMESREYEDAMDIFDSLSDYKDSEQKKQDCLQLKRAEYRNLCTNRIAVSVLDASYALTEDGTVLATGNNEDGQLNVDKWSNIIGISASQGYAVGLKTDGTVISTKEISGLESWKDITDISAGYGYLAGLRKDGTVVTVGTSEYTVGKKEDTASWKNIIAISQGSDTLVGLKSDGTVVGCGDNYYGQLEIDNWHNIIQIETEDTLTVGLKSDGTVVCVGYADGINIDTSDWHDIVQIAAQPWGIIGLKSDGTLVSEGLGVDESREPVDDSHLTGLSVDGLRDIIAIDTDFNTICVKEDGTVISIGALNYYGQQNVEKWNNIISTIKVNSSIEKIKAMEIVPFKVVVEKSRAQENAEEREKEKQAKLAARINNNAPIHIGMSKHEVSAVLANVTDEDIIEEDENGEYVINITNELASRLFDVDSVNKLPKLESVHLSFDDDSLDNIGLEIKTNSSIEQIVKAMGGDVNAIRRSSTTVDNYNPTTHKDNSYLISRGTFVLNDREITISTSSNTDITTVILYSNW